MPRESRINCKKRTGRIIAALKKQFPDAKTVLDHSDSVQLLVATILSAQCTDVRVNIVTKHLFKKYKTVADYAAAKPAELEQEIRSTGFYRNKTKNIIGAARKIITDFDGKLPDTMEELLTLPGVARKTANCVLGNAFGKAEGVVVDTHVIRLSNRLGLSKHTDPVKIEKDLMALVPQKDWILFSHLIIFHGRATCAARKPDCQSCTLSKLCPSVFAF